MCVHVWVWGRSMGDLCFSMWYVSRRPLGRTVSVCVICPTPVLPGAGRDPSVWTNEKVMCPMTSLYPLGKTTPRLVGSCTPPAHHCTWVRTDTARLVHRHFPGSGTYRVPVGFRLAPNPSGRTCDPYVGGSKTLTLFQTPEASGVEVRRSLQRIVVYARDPIRLPRGGPGSRESTLMCRTRIVSPVSHP